MVYSKVILLSESAEVIAHDIPPNSAAFCLRSRRWHAQRGSRRWKFSHLSVALICRSSASSSERDKYYGTLARLGCQHRCLPQGSRATETRLPHPYGRNKSGRWYLSCYSATPHAGRSL